MCGINGIYQFENLDKDLEKVQKMNLVTFKRGPDNKAIYSDHDVIFGHNRLSIIDVNKESNQPFVSNDKNIVLTYNGELYNYLTLKKELSSTYDFKTKSDTEVIIAAYLYWGIDMLDYLNGIFAFALWDKQNNQFYLTRDRLGVKPLYYLETKKSIIFSSSIKSLCTFIESEVTASRQELLDFLTYGTVHSPNTIVNNVKSLSRGCYLFANSDESTIIEYWSFFKKNNLEQTNYSEVIKKVKNLILESIEKRLISDVPYGIFLSGGIDSSILVAAASEVSKSTVNTFSITFEEKEFDEKIYSRKVAKMYNTNHNEIKILPDEIFNNIELPFYAMDHPTIDGINTFFISKAVSEKGFKMAISGAGADELFAGYPVFKQAQLLDNKKWLYSFPPQLRNTFGKLLKWYNPSAKTEKKADILNQKFLELAYYYPIFRRIFSKKSIVNILNYKPKQIDYFPFTWAKNEIQNGNRGENFPFLSKISALEMETYLQNVLLRDADQMGMANSLEIRVPYLDHNLVDFVFSVKDEFKYPLYPKKLLVDSAGDLISDEIAKRKKMGFVFPWEIWMKNELRDFCYKSINELERTKVFDMKSVFRLWDYFLNNGKEVHWLNIWTLVVLGKWISINKISFNYD